MNNDLPWTDFSPAKYQVWCWVKMDHHVEATNSNWYRHRVGTANSYNAAKAAIERDRDAMLNTYGGLMAADNRERVYKIYRLDGDWTACE